MKRIAFVLCFVCSFLCVNAQILLTQSFDATGFPPTGWLSTTGGSGFPLTAWSRVGNGLNPGNTPRSGAGQIRLNAFDAQSGTASLITPALDFSFTTGIAQVSVWIYRENLFASPIYAGEGVEILVNTTASATGATSLGFVNRLRSLAPVVAADGWYQYTYTIPPGFNGPSNYIIVNGTSMWGANIYVDDLEVSRRTPCSGTPPAGNAFASVDSICASAPFVLNDTAFWPAGVSFQWQSAPAGSGTWSNIPGATTVPYNYRNGITASTDFRLLVTCAASSQTGISGIAQVATKVFFNCYCSSGSNLTEDNIGQVSFGTGFANPAIAPTVLTGNPAANAKYTDHTALGPIAVVPGGSMPFALTQINQNAYWPCGLAVYADFNHNSSFSDPGELIYGPAMGPVVGGSPTFTGQLPIPSSALPGITRLRFVLVERTTAISPCGNYNWGETEDYLIDVISAMPPAPDLTTNGPVCEGQPLLITASIPVSYPNPVYHLTHPALGTQTSTTGVFSIPAAACANGGTYTASVTSQNLTSSAATVNAVVNCVPTIAVSAPTAPTGCTGDDGSFTISGLLPATRYSLSYRKNGVPVASPVPVTSDASGTAAVTGLAAANYDMIVVQTAAGCSSNTVTATVVVPTPQTPAMPVIAVNPQPLCAGSTAVISVSNPDVRGSYRWSGPNGFSDTGRIVSIANFNAGRDGNYSVIATVNGCISAAGSANVLTRPGTPKPIRNNVSYCQFDAPVAMNALTIAGNLVEWYDTCSGGPGCIAGIRSRGSILAAPNPPTPNTSIPGIVMWVVRQTEPNGCPSDYDSVYVRVLPRPAAPAAGSLTLEYCQYEVVGALTVNGLNVKWFTTPTGGNGSVTAPVPSTNTPGTYHFYASQTTADGCEGDRVKLTVIIKPKPQPPTVVSPLNLCQGDAPAVLTALGQSLQWYTLPNGGSGVPVAPQISTSYEDSFVHYVTQTVDGCESDRALLASYVRYKPNGIITATSSSVCEGGIDTFSYYGNGRGDAEYVWFAPLSAEVVNGNAAPGPIAIRFDTAGTSTVQLIVNNKGCISRLLAAPVIVRPLPEISFVNRQDVCADELVNLALRAIEPGITSYKWEFGPEGSIVYGEPGTGGPYGLRYSRAGHYSVSAAATKAGCTSRPVIHDIYVHERPRTEISYDYRNGRPLDQFCASDTLRLSVPALSEGGTYVWSPAPYFQNREDSLNSEVSAVVSQSSYVHVKVRNAFGCEASDSLYVPAKACCGVYFPNAFTPGSQVEQNRLFRPITTGIHRINNFRVMNRWGQVIWESVQERAGWDGTFNGVPQDMGTYFFYINYRCGDKNVEDKGEILLVR